MKAYIGQTHTYGPSVRKRTSHILVLDQSWSMWHSKKDLLKFTGEFFKHHQNFKVILFNSYIKNYSVQDESSLKAMQEEIKCEYSTNTAGAIQELTKMIIEDPERSKTTNLAYNVIFVSDGVANDIAAGQDAARELQRQTNIKNIDLNIIPCNYGVNADTRVSVALTTSGDFLRIENNQLSNDRFEEIMSRTSPPPMFGFTGTGCKLLSEGDDIVSPELGGLLRLTIDTKTTDFKIFADQAAPVKEHLLAITNKKPADSEHVTWREITESDRDILASILLRAKGVLAGQVTLGARFKDQDRADLHLLLQALQATLIADQTAQRGNRLRLRDLIHKWTYGESKDIGLLQIAEEFCAGIKKIIGLGASSNIKQFDAVLQPHHHKMRARLTHQAAGGRSLDDKITKFIEHVKEPSIIRRLEELLKSESASDVCTFTLANTMGMLDDLLDLAKHAQGNPFNISDLIKEVFTQVTTVAGLPAEITVVNPADAWTFKLKLREDVAVLVSPAAVLSFKESHPPDKPKHYESWVSIIQPSMPILYFMKQTEMLHIVSSLMLHGNPVDPGNPAGTLSALGLLALIDQHKSENSKSFKYLLPKIFDQILISSFTNHSSALSLSKLRYGGENKQNLIGEIKQKRPNQIYAGLLSLPMNMMEDNSLRADITYEAFMHLYVTNAINLREFSIRYLLAKHLRALLASGVPDFHASKHPGKAHVEVINEWHTQIHIKDDEGTILQTVKVPEGAKPAVDHEARVDLDATLVCYTKEGRDPSMAAVYQLKAAMDHMQEHGSYDSGLRAWFTAEGIFSLPDDEALKAVFADLCPSLSPDNVDDFLDNIKTMSDKSTALPTRDQATDKFIAVLKKFAMHQKSCIKWTRFTTNDANNNLTATKAIYAEYSDSPMEEVLKILHGHFSVGFTAPIDAKWDDFYHEDRQKFVLTLPFSQLCDLLMKACLDDATKPFNFDRSVEILNAVFSLIPPNPEKLSTAEQMSAIVKPCKSVFKSVITHFKDKKQEYDLDLLTKYLLNEERLKTISPYFLKQLMNIHPHYYGKYCSEFEKKGIVAPLSMIEFCDAVAVLFKNIAESKKLTDNSFKELMSNIEALSKLIWKEDKITHTTRTTCWKAWREGIGKYMREIYQWPINQLFGGEGLHVKKIVKIIKTFRNIGLVEPLMRRRSGTVEGKRPGYPANHDYYRVQYIETERDVTTIKEAYYPPFLLRVYFSSPTAKTRHVTGVDPYIASGDFKELCKNPREHCGMEPGT